MSENRFYDAPMREDALYWDIKRLKKLLAYNCDIVGAQSPRNVGKSYSAMMLCQEALDKGKDVCWGRYNSVELSMARDTWLEFNPNLKKIKDMGGLSTKWYRDEATDGRIMFYSWNISQNIKGVDYPFVYNVCDEFIPERYTNRTRLDTEFGDWNSVYKSIKRKYPMKTIMLSNNIKWFNPFFLGWEIQPFAKGQIQKSITDFTVEAYGQTFKTKRTVAFENVGMSPAIIERIIADQALEATSSAELQSYIDNATKTEYCTFAICPDLSIPLSHHQCMSDGYYMSWRICNGLAYWCKVKPDRTKCTIVAEQDNVNPLTNHIRDRMIPQWAEDWFDNGKCVFDKAETLTAFLRWVRKSRVRIA